MADLQLFKFSAFNSQALFGWGDEAEAEAYCDHLNRDREINVYSFEEITDADEIERRDDGETGVNLGDTLSAIADESDT